MHKLYCIIGRTASGKSTITRLASEKLNMNVLKSYTTRKPRKGETAKNSDHTFISTENVNSYRNDMVAYTERVDYCSFATKQQIMNSDFFHARCLTTSFHLMTKIGFCKTEHSLTLTYLIKHSKIIFNLIT